MTKFNEFFRFNQKAQDGLKKITEPLKTHFGIDWFWHATIHEDGSFSNISTSHDQWAHLWDNECYKNVDHLVAPSNLKSGYFHLEFEPDYKKVQDTSYVKKPLNHPFINIRKEGKTKAHIFGFGASKDIPTLPSFYTNNIPILNSFIDYFLNSKLSSKDVMINIAELRDPNNFYRRGYGEGMLTTPKNHCLFLKKIGMSSELFGVAGNLTKREKDVLLDCLEGKTAAQCAEELGISPRTVQSYMENIKNRLGVLTRKELIESGKILKLAGFLE